MIQIKKFNWVEGASPLEYYRIFKYIGPSILGKQADVEHQTMNGKLHSEIEIEKKNNTLLREDLQAKDLEMGRMMKKLQN